MVDKDVIRLRPTHHTFSIRVEGIDFRGVIRNEWSMKWYRTVLVYSNKSELKTCLKKACKGLDKGFCLDPRFEEFNGEYGEHAADTGEQDGR